MKDLKSFNCWFVAFIIVRGKKSLSKCFYDHFLFRVSVSSETRSGRVELCIHE